MAGSKNKKQNQAPIAQQGMLIRKAEIIMGFVLVAFALFVLVSLATYQRADIPEMTHSPVHTEGISRQALPVHNFGGIIGAKTAHYLLMHFGLAAFLAAFLMGLFSVWMIIGRSPLDYWIRLIGAVVLLGATCVMMEFLFSFYSFRDVAAPGGFAGVYLWHHVFLPYIGRAGTIIFASLLILLSLYLVFDDLLFKAFGLCVRAVAAMRQAGGQLQHKLQDLRQEQKQPQKESEEWDEEEEDKDEVVEAAKQKSATPEAVSTKTEKPAKKSGVIKRLRSKGSKKKTAKIKKQPPVVEAPAASKKKTPGVYMLPPDTLLDMPEKPHAEFKDGALASKNKSVLQETLQDFNVDCTVLDFDQGPVVTMFELELGPGVKVGKIASLADDMAIALKAPNVRIVAPIPGKSTIGIEVPNLHQKTIRLKDLMGGKNTKKSRMKIPLYLGMDASGKSGITDMTEMPHMLIAGTTGSGKSVCINAILLSILLTRTPDEVKLILIDPKMVELAAYKGITHLRTDVVVDMKKAADALARVCKEMDDRYILLSKMKVRNIGEYNKIGAKEIRRRWEELPDSLMDNAKEPPAQLPFWVVVVDELADLMMVAAKEVETYITRIAQRSRAAGIHLILATQRPSVDVITGLIKANMPSRLSFQVATKVDSRTILDRNGAEKLLGKGDMLFLPPGTSELTRAQGAFVSEEEVRRIVQFVRDQETEAEYEELDQFLRDTEKANTVSGTGERNLGHDELYEEAVRVILETGRASVSLLQRRLQIGYTRAARLVDIMEDNAVVGPSKGSKPREILITEQEWKDSQQ